VPGPAIVSPRRALSVFLLSLVPLFRVQSVAFDPASRTSEALARIIFAEFYGTRPRFRPDAPVPETMLQENDAALLIGDVALRYRAEHPFCRASAQEALLREGPEPIQSFDLAERWNNLTGLPAVFAFWAVRPGFSGGNLRELLVASRAHGLANLEAIAGIWAGKLDLERDFVRAYLEKNLDYHMDIHAVEALRVFYGLAREHGILGRVRDLIFYEDQ
jgi:chorismate dehydratase